MVRDELKHERTQESLSRPTDSIGAGRSFAYSPRRMAPVANGSVAYDLIVVNDNSNHSGKIVVN